MNSLNSILLEGNLTKNPRLGETSRGTPVLHFSVASNRFYKMGEEWNKEVSYFDVEAWSTLAKRMSEQISKGIGVRVVGRLKQQRWVAEDGTTKSNIIIVAEHIEVRPSAFKVESAADELERDEVVAAESEG